MKLFKKLAAVALAAVLALSMVGCGGMQIVLIAPSMIVLKLAMADIAGQNDAEINNTAATGRHWRQNLLNTGSGALWLLRQYAGKGDAGHSAGCCQQDRRSWKLLKHRQQRYQVQPRRSTDHQFKSSLISNTYKQQLFFMNLQWIQLYCEQFRPCEQM